MPKIMIESLGLSPRKKEMMTKFVTAYPKMKKSYKTKWLKALRSGKYRQTRKGFLINRNNNGTTLGYCCLGCLKEICNLQGENNKRLSNCSKRTIGLTEEAEDKLIAMNDEAHYNFNKIADWIEENL